MLYKYILTLSSHTSPTLNYATRQCYLEDKQDVKESTPKNGNKGSKYVSSPSLFTTDNIYY